MRATYVYFFRPVGAEGPIKIGCSFLPHERLLAYAHWSPVPLQLIGRVAGNQRFEKGLHAALREHHSHGEWFRPAPQVLAMVADAIAGKIDVTTLPQPRNVWGMAPRRPEDTAAGVMVRRLGAMMKKGVVVPDHVRNATHTYQCPPEEKARRRAIVREWVTAQGASSERAA